jgi:intergrase/recombinase
MANMSYCRFNNTSMDLDECLEAIDGREIESDEEALKARKMFKRFLEFCQYEGIIENYDEEIMEDLIFNSIDNQHEEDERNER